MDIPEKAALNFLKSALIASKVLIFMPTYVISLLLSVIIIINDS
jgi:hypothetical protein